MSRMPPPLWIVALLLIINAMVERVTFERFSQLFDSIRRLPKGPIEPPEKLTTDLPPMVRSYDPGRVTVVFVAIRPPLSTRSCAFLLAPLE